MTLFRQLLLVLTLVFSALFFSSILVSTQHAARYIEHQLSEHARDSAITLSLAIAHASDMNPTIIERMLAAAFDRAGLYQELAFRSEDLGDIVKALPSRGAESSRQAGAPDWFRNLLPLQPARATEPVSSGWYQIGTLEVVTSPAAAYQDLWRIALEQLMLTLLALALTALVLVILLRALFRPLLDVEHQAIAIARGEFRRLDPVPRTRELGRVVQAMNAMVAQLKRLFADQVAVAEAFRDQALRDPLTGLGNRREFDQRLLAHLSQPEAAEGGPLMLIALADFGAYNQAHGHLAGDALLKTVAQTLLSACSGTPDALLARNGGANFIAFVPGLLAEQARAQVANIFNALCQLPETRDDASPTPVSIGATYCDGRGEPARLLSECDLALRSAQSQSLGQSAWHYFAQSDPLTGQPKTVMPASAWERLLRQTLEDNTLVLVFQPVFSIPDRTLIHHEAYVRLAVDGAQITAGQFLPMAEHFKLLPALDRQVIEQAWRQLEADTGIRLAVNLSIQSLRDSEFTTWLLAALSRHTTSTRLTIELPEYGIALAAADLERLFSAIQQRGAQICIDHFGAGRADFSYLQALSPDCVKLDHSFVRDIRNRADNRFFVQAMARIADGQGVAMYAEGVEDGEDLSLLAELGITGAMGYALGPPGRLPPSRPDV